MKMPLLAPSVSNHHIRNVTQRSQLRFGQAGPSMFVKETDKTDPILSGRQEIDMNQKTEPRMFEYRRIRAEPLVHR